MGAACFGVYSVAVPNICWPDEASSRWRDSSYARGFGRGAGWSGSSALSGQRAFPRGGSRFGGSWLSGLPAGLPNAAEVPGPVAHPSDIAGRRNAEQATILAAELGRTLVPDPIAGCRGVGR